MKKLIKKITAVGISAILLFALSACGSDKEDSSYSSTSTPVAAVKSEETNNTSYYSILESTNNNALRFNMTLDEFMERYNDLIIKYNETYSIVDKAFIIGNDFNRLSPQTNHNNITAESYVCYSTLFGYNENTAIIVNVESESHKISDIALGIDTEFFNSLNQSQRTLWTIQNHLIYETMVNDLNSEEKLYNIDEEIQKNTKQYSVPATYKNGIDFCLDFNENLGVTYLRLLPCTVKQWEENNMLNKIPINSMEKAKASLNVESSASNNDENNQLDNTTAVEKATPIFKYFYTNEEEETITPIIDKLKSQYGNKINFDIINISENPEILETFPIVTDNTPTLIMIDTNNEVSDIKFQCVDIEILKETIDEAIK